MATTQQIRESYPEFITRWPTSSSEPRCDFSRAVPVLFPASASISSTRRIALRVHPATRQIWRAMGAVLLHYGYEFRETAGGTLACRRITGGSRTTLHAHGVAGDWNPSKNRYRVSSGAIQWGIQTDMPRAMVRAIEAITMTNGRHPLEWGGRWWNIKDPMHYQLDQTKANLAPVNLATLPAGAWTRYLAFETNTTTPTKGDDVHLPLVLGDGYDSVPDWTSQWSTSGDRPNPGEDRSRKIEDVRDLQDRLNKLGAGLTLDGLYGPSTRAAAEAIGGSWTGHPDGKAGRWWGGNQHGELDWTIALEAARRAGGGGTVDQTARNAAAEADKKARAARSIAEDAKTGAARANSTLDKIRSE